MKKRFPSLFLSALFFFVLFFCGCNKEPQGIYYPALSGDFLEEPLSETDISEAELTDTAYLYYKEKLYTCSQKRIEFSKKNLPLEQMLGDELGTVYSNHNIYWSDTIEKLHETTSTATLYQVAAYDEAFRVCLYFEEPAKVSEGLGETFHLYVFECTNDITLHTGRDYYEALYHLDSDTSFDSLNPEDNAVSTFVDVLLNAEFIDPEQADLPTFDFDRNNTYYLSFTDSLGLTGSFAVYEDGYVVDPADHNFILKLNPAFTTVVLDKLPEVVWPGFYTYSTSEIRNGTRFGYYIRLKITETDTHLTFDLSERRRATGTDTIGPGYNGISGTISLAKADLKDSRVISFILQPHPEHPELIIYVELKKGLQDDIIYLRYGETEEELAEKEYMPLSRTMESGFVLWNN